MNFINKTLKMTAQKLANCIHRKERKNRESTIDVQLIHIVFVYFFLFIIDSYACKCYFRVCDWSTCHFWAKQMRIDNRRAFVTLKNFDQNNINKLSMFLECPSKLHTQNRRQYAIASENNQQWFKFLVNELTTRHRRWRKKNTHTSQHKIGFSKLILISNST